MTDRQSCALWSLSMYDASPYVSLVSDTKPKIYNMECLYINLYESGEVLMMQPI